MDLVTECREPLWYPGARPATEEHRPLPLRRGLWTGSVDLGLKAVRVRRGTSCGPGWP